ncbi:hypothetical protein AX17_005556 [Amanita inopinata Kibby_2008]|nr:hypothetical protein AX17_005556 [Amanita inopinata Kibby_2008]
MSIMPETSFSTILVDEYDVGPGIKKDLPELGSDLQAIHQSVKLMQFFGTRCLGNVAGMLSPDSFSVEMEQVMPSGTLFPPGMDVLLFLFELNVVLVSVDVCIHLGTSADIGGEGEGESRGLSRDDFACVEANNLGEGCGCDVATSTLEDRRPSS